MKIEATVEGICLKEVFEGIMMETFSGNKIGVCMRNNTFEINILPKGSTEHNWWRVDMQNGTVVEMLKG